MNRSSDNEPDAPNRRQALQGLTTGPAALMALAALASPAVRAAGADTAEPVPFTKSTVVEAAEALAASPYQEMPRAPRRLRELDYDGYRQFKFQGSQSIWGRSQTRFAVELFAPGYLYEDLIDIHVVESGMARPIPMNAEAFQVSDPELAEALNRAGRYSGFRMIYPISRPDVRDEFLVFQGASYFRGISSSQQYGLSARGLALDVASPDGEEFPVFRTFWIERPSASSEAVVIHALLDSPSVAGAYRFGIYPGPTLTMDIKAVLFPRRPLRKPGLAPLTSMFLHGPLDGPDIPDYRPSVHDSQGLAITTGSGERIWRPLANPRTLQISAFMDTNPQGFGLAQRDRTFQTYQDLEARYELRPSAWVLPFGNWGEGHVELVEIPTPSEGNDNIVAYWRPRQTIPAGQAYAYAYRLTWPDALPAAERTGTVIYSSGGRKLGTALQEVVVDYDLITPVDPSLVTVEASLSTGRLVETIVVDHPVRKGLRIFVAFDPEGEDLIEMRVRPLVGGNVLGETWLYRWIAP